MKYLESFFWGIIAALGALVLELIFSQIAQLPNAPAAAFGDTGVTSSFWFLAAGAFTEEFFKFIVIAKRFSKISSRAALIFSSLVLGLGFSAFEIFLIFQNIGIRANPNIANIFFIGLLHILTAGIIGFLWYYLKNKPAVYFLLPLLAATTLHLVFNWLVIHNF